MKDLFQFSGRKFVCAQIAITIIAIVGLFFVNITLANVLATVLMYYALMIVGVSIMLHRYWAHRSFQFKSSAIKTIFSLFALLSCRGSPLAWAHIHRDHHRYSDTDKDPHRPTTFKLFSFRTTFIPEVKIFLIKDFLNSRHKFLHDKYFLILLGWFLFLACFGLSAVVFVGALPIVLCQMTQDIWNFVSHIPKIGYRNFQTTDASNNTIMLWPLIMGETWHNNHHKFPGSANLKRSWWEFDPAYLLICLVRK